MAFSKITNADFKDKGALSLPDQPTIAPQELKRKFDEDAREVVAPAFNKLVEQELPDSSAAANIGAASPTGRTVQNPTVQSVMNKVSDDLATLEQSVGQAIADAHTHDNKALLDDYNQSNTDITDAVNKKHAHSNLSLLETYTQTESNLADAVSKKHSHSNLALLETYAQTEANLADAVSKKHSHNNLSLLETYTQTEANLADAVTKKHTHTNKTVIDKFGEDSGGNPTYDGNPIGGGGQADAYKTIEAAGQSFVASGADTFKINAGSNVTIEALTGSDKGIKINATGGGQSTGDMLMSQYDNSGDVKNASSTGNGIKDFVASEIGKLDVSDSAVSGQYVSSVSETDGKITVTRTNLPAVPTKVSDLTNDSGYQTASDVSTAIAGKADTSSLGDLAYIDIDGSSSTKVLQGDGTWVTPSTGGHDMIPIVNPQTNVEDIDAVKALQNGNDEYVINAYTAKRWSNCDAKITLTTANQNDDGVGTWEDDATWESGSRVGWLWSADFYQILEDGNGNEVTDIEVIPIFDVSESEAVSLYAYRIDDDVTYNNTHGGAVAFKFNGAIKSANGVKVGLKLVHQRTEVNDTGTRLT